MIVLIINIMLSNKWVFKACCYTGLNLLFIGDALLLFQGINFLLGCIGVVSILGTQVI
jgi:hypothetical protein